MIKNLLFSPQLFLVDCYLSIVLSTLLEVLLESVNQLIFRETIFCWNFQSIRILKYFDIIDFWLLSFVYYLLKQSIIYFFVRKVHVCTFVLKSWNGLYLISWILIIYYMTFFVYVWMQEVPCGLCRIVCKIFPSWMVPDNNLQKFPSKCHKTDEKSPILWCTFLHQCLNF